MELKKKISIVIHGIITIKDCTHAKRVCKDFEIKNLGKYHDLYAQRKIYYS